MAPKHMKIYSTSLGTRETQMKTSIRCHYMSIRMANVKNSDNTKCQQGFAETGSYTALLRGL